MISWIQREFQHHFKVIFGVLLVITIVSFIVTIGASPGLGRADRTPVERHFFGYNLGSQEDQGRLFGDAALSAQLQTGYNGLENEQIQSYAFQRAAALALADQFHVPPASSQEIADAIKNLRMFTGDDGQFDAKRYANFRDSLKTNPRLTEAVVSRVIADDVRMKKVQDLVSGPGYVQPDDVKTQLDRADSTWTLSVASADYTAFAPSIPTADSDLAKFFEENSFRYEIAPRVVVSSADFPALNYLGSVSVTDGEVRAYYDANPSQFPKPPAASKAVVPAKPDPAADYAAVRPQVESTLKLERARRLAAKAASDFSYALYESKVAPGTAAFDQFLAAQKIGIRTLAPFTREDGPTEFAGSKEIAAEAFKLNASRAYSDAIATSTGAVVLFWKEILPSRKPLLSEVHAKVAVDYTDNEKTKRFIEVCKAVRGTIETRLKAGDTFEKAATAAAASSSLKLDTKTLAPFTRRQPPQDAENAVISAIDRLEKGAVSDMIRVKDKGYFVYVADKKLPDLSETSPQFTTMRAQIAQANSRIGSSAYFSEIVAQELKQSEPATK